MGRPLFDPSRIAGPLNPAAPSGADALLTVSKLTAMVKRAIADGIPSTVHVVGEISNLKRHSSGHVYLTLKDDASELACVLWKSAAASLKFKPENGLEVIATGNVDVFERAGRYQLYVRKLEPRGVGALDLAFRQLQRKLEAEGLFDPKHKKPLPRFPRRIGVITSPTGAAIRDVLQTLRRRYPCAEVLLFPVSVQGPTAAGEIAAAIRLLDRDHARVGGIDVLIVGRGGGSLEDLWAFNEEVVARAIYACGIPVVSAVGHEVDVTISDLVADVRAATPTAAAELVAPALDDLLACLSQQEGRLVRGVTQGLNLALANLIGLLHRGVYREPIVLVRRREQIIDEMTGRLWRALAERVHDRQRAVARCELLLQRIHPETFFAKTANRVAERIHRLQWALSRRLSIAERQLTRRTESLAAVSPVRPIERLDDRVDRCERRLCVSVIHRLELLSARVNAESRKLDAMSYRRTLARGFSITRTRKGRVVLRDGKNLRPGDRLLTETAGGEVESAVVDKRQLDLFD